jgi:hypothetical protein
MATKYGWCCPRCGAFKNSNSRDEVQAFKMYHKRNNHRCDLQITKADTLAKPALAKHLDKTEYKHMFRRPKLFKRNKLSK